VPEPSILFMCSTLHMGGAERQWAMLLPGLVRRGFDVRLVTLAARGRFFDEIEATGIPSGCAGLKSRWDLRGITRAFELARPFPDLVVSHETNAHFIGHWVAAAAKAAHVTVGHRGPGMAHRRYRRTLERFVARHVDHAIAVSRSQLREFEAAGFDLRRVSVIHNGLDPLRPERSRAEVRASLGLRESAFVALVVAALRPVKRVDVFVEAVAAAHRADDRIVGLVAGGGASLESFRAMAEARRSPVQLLGERADIADLMIASDVACLTSSAEATPMALIEAMSLGRPVLAPAAGGIPEIVIDGETGILVPARDGAGPDPEEFARGLRALAADRPLAEALGTAGSVRYQRLFTARRMLDEYERLFSGLARTREGRLPDRQGARD
jgi:glycosyltransferase involved in cell wall biosynthesis